jgi:energy-coupling factor transporter ATP-binding protein EcfA2
MAEYDFSTLNGTDLEDLTCDLINADQPVDSNIRYKTFKEGKDKGIDFLYSTEINPYAHVGQVKHYLGSGFSGLISTLKKKELDKVKKLNPNKYIVSTSVDLSVADTESIKKIFIPYIKSLNDIYGKKDLNRLIEAYPDVLNSHFKLWFSDTTVFQKLLNSNLEYRSVDFLDNEIKRRLQIYVETSAFKKARKYLKSNKFIVITGEPGVGKTTLAEMLAYEYIKDDYELIYIYDSIKDADSALTPDDSKQIIYFDDFLGSNEIEINKARGSDTILNKVLRRVKQGSNKILIFTTRKHILNRAILESEKLKRFNILTGENILHLDDYSTDIRETLLVNHIECSQLPEEFKDLLFSKELFSFILKHKYFSPRSVEFITTKETVGNTTIQNFEEFVKDSFDNPTEIWKHAYINQLNEDDRLLLNTLLSFGDEISKERLQSAFDERINYEITYNNKTRVMHAFKHAYQRLLGGFVYSTKEEMIRFINPSLIDFLLKYIRLDKIEVEKIASSVIDVDQLTKRLFSLTYQENKPIMPDILQERLLRSYDSFLSGDDDDGELIVLALVIYKYVDSKKKVNVVCEILNDIDEWELLYENYDLSIKFQEFMTEVRGNSAINSIIEERITEIISELVLSDSDFDGAYGTLSDLISKYDLNLSSFNTGKIDEHFAEILQEYVSNEVEWLTDFVTDESEVSELNQKIESKLDKVNSLGLDVELDLSEITDVDWYEVAWSNELRRLMEKDD